MPFIGSEIEITSSEQLSKLDDSARLSVQQRKGQTLLVATKRTLADGFYTIWAKFCPQQEQQQQKLALEKVKALFSLPNQEKLEMPLQGNLPTLSPQSSSPYIKNWHPTFTDLRKHQQIQQSQQILRGTVMSDDQKEKIGSATPPKLKIPRDEEPSQALNQELFVKKILEKEGFSSFDETLKTLPEEKAESFRAFLRNFSKDIFQLAQKNEKLDYFSALKNFNIFLNTPANPEDPKIEDLEKAFSESLKNPTDTQTPKIATFSFKDLQRVCAAYKQFLQSHPSPRAKEDITQ